MPNIGLFKWFICCTTVWCTCYHSFIFKLNRSKCFLLSVIVHTYSLRNWQDVMKIVPFIFGKYSGNIETCFLYWYCTINHLVCCCSGCSHAYLCMTDILVLILIPVTEMMLIQFEVPYINLCMKLSLH